jgi:hypothetical protein
LGREFDPSANTIRKWPEQAGVDEGLRGDGQSTEERGGLRQLRRKVKQFELERGILEEALYPVRTMCRVLQVSASGFYAWLGRGPSKRPQANAVLLGTIQEVHEENDSTYGAPRIHAELTATGPDPLWVGASSTTPPA